MEYPTDPVLVVIGATNCYGYHLIHQLKDIAPVVPLEDNFINLLFSTDVWNVWDSYESWDLKPGWIDFSVDMKIKRVLQAHKPSAIVYASVYSVLDIYRERTDFTEKAATALKNFVSLLDVIRTTCSKVTVILPLIELSSPIQRAWLKQFEVTLVTYQTLYDLNVALLHISTGYELESDGDCEYHVLQLAKIDTHIYDKLYDYGHSIKLASCKEDATFNYSNLCTYMYSKNASSVLLKKDVVFTTYFTSRPDPNRFNHMPQNYFRYIKKWFVGAMHQGLDVVVFYDELDVEWIRRAEKAYPQATFVASDLKYRSVNDDRYYILRDYLKSHPEIGRVFLTDGSDMQIWGNPFQLMDILGNEMLYVGQDKPYWISLDDLPYNVYTRSTMRQCYGEDIYERERELVQYYSVYNAGLSGGMRHAYLGMLERVIDNLEVTLFKPDRNCNMAAFNIVLHKYFFEQIFLGYPLQSGFEVSSGLLGPVTPGIPGPFGQIFKHK